MAADHDAARLTGSVRGVHRFSGTTGEAADLMAEVARRLDASRAQPHQGSEDEALRRKRFHAALALARHDPAAAAAALRRLLSELR